MKNFYLLALLALCLSSSKVLDAQIISVNPDTVVQSQTINIDVTAQNIDFSQGTNTIYFKQGNTELYTSKPSVSSKTSITIRHKFTFNDPLGYYKLFISNSYSGVTYSRDSAICVKPNLEPASIEYIMPTTAKKGETITITVYGINTHFNKAGLTNYVTLQNGSNSIGPVTTTPIDEITLKAEFAFTGNNPPGLYSVNVNNLTDGTITKSNAFSLQSGSITPAILTVVPDHAVQGQTLDIGVTAENIDFTQGTNVVSFKQGNTDLPMYLTYKNNPTSMTIHQTFTTDNPTGYYDLWITNTAANVTLKKVNAIYVNPNLTIPTLGSITPTSAHQGETVIVTVLGSNTSFNKSGVTNYVYLQNGNKQIVAEAITPIDSIRLEARFVLTYAHPPGFYSINVRNNVDGTITKPNAFELITGPDTPKILTVAPDSAIQGQALDIDVTAQNVDFTQGTNMVYLKQGSEEIAFYFPVINSATSLTIHHTFNLDHSTGFYNLSVYNTSSENLLTKTNAIYVKPYAALPSLESITPNTAKQGEIVTITFTGTNTHFDKPGIINSVFLKNGNKQINATTLLPIDSVTLEAGFTLTYSQAIGLYSANVYNDTDGTLSIPNAFGLNEGLNTPRILKVTPDTLVAGQTLDIEITAENIDFTQGTNIVTIRQGSSDIYMNSSTADSPTTLFANITVSDYFPSGEYNLSIWNTSFDILLLSNQTLVREKAFYLKSPNLIISVIEIPEDKILFYPNPVNHNLFLKKKYEIIQLFDINGRKVLESKQVEILDVSGLHKGIYFIKLMTGNAFVVRKLIVD